MSTDTRFSKEIGRRLGSESAFERELFTEVVRRVSHLRRVGFVIPPTRWYDWLAPATSASVITLVYYTYVFPKF